MIDLHTHTTYSDGTLTPEEIILKAKEDGLNAVAITDHDTLAGLKEGILYSKKYNIDFIPGVEIEIDHPYNGEFHLLGLDLKELNGPLQSKLEELQGYREIRNHKIVKRINKEGLNISYKEVQDLAGGDVIGRPHFAQILVNKGFIKNKDEAFKKYLNSGMPFYIEKKVMKLDEAIKLIHNAGGKAIIAHPQSLFISWSKLPSVLKSFKDLGLDGIEAWHSGNNKNDCIKFEKIASDLRLIVTGGSDYHGGNFKNRSFGFGAGKRRIPDILLENLRKGIK